ncbi:MAG: hypothetical protein NT038_10710 [Euryarchaeota archaeon]|nr:hypothetical protein [Euryarchaeota archaeon]
MAENQVISNISRDPLDRIHHYLDDFVQAYTSGFLKFRIGKRYCRPFRDQEIGINLRRAIGKIANKVESENSQEISNFFCIYIGLIMLITGVK